MPNTPKSAPPPAAGSPGGRRKTDRPDAAAKGKMLPPRDTVEVPRQPPKPIAGTPDEAAKDSRPARDNQDESNWADGSRPRPHAKNARSHLL
ncbi:hypothetical protein [Bordetella petrii]|uniref:hypothetical protein n=1 Tax=Bordetella petrii TaxID=94624 RepID=UPI001A96E4AE|nr:hypothetical protein [Bordetella petrii]MBO1113778.1 hypothetical protein [Bordetella petrii]